MDSDDEIRYERDWDTIKRLEREKANLTTQLARAVAQFKEKELHLKNHIKEQELQMKNHIKEKELQMKNQIKEKELDFEKQIAETKLQCKKQIKESTKIIQFLDEKLHKIGVSERTIFLNKPNALRDVYDVKWGLGYENPNLLKKALQEKSAFYDLSSMLMSTRFPSLKGFEMKEEFSEMQEMKKHDPLYYDPKYHRVKFVYNSDTLRIKSKDTSNSSDFLVYPDINSAQESVVEAKPYVPTLVLEEKIVDLENLLKKTQSEYESLKFKEQNEHNAEREMLLEQIQILQQVVYESEHDLVNERSRFAKDREEYVQEIFELQRTVADLQKLLEDKAGQEKQNVELEVAKERHVFETEIEKLTKTVSDLQNTLLEERKVFDLTSVNLSKKISELERKIILDKKNSLKKPSLRAGKYQNMMHEFEEEIQGVHTVRKVDDKKCIELQKQIVDLQNQLSDVRHQFKQKEKVLRHEKSVLEQIIAEPKKPSLVEADFEDQKEVFKAEIRKLTSKLSELSTNIMNEQRMRSDQQKKLDDLLEERNKFSSKVKELEKTTFKAHDSSNVDSASLSNINSSGQIRTSNLFYDRRVDYSGLGYKYLKALNRQSIRFGPQKRRRIYVGYESPSIICYLEPLTGDLFTASLDDMLKRNKTVIDDVFIFAVATDIMSNDDMEPRTIVECQRRTDWPQWKQAIQDELDSLTKIRVFGPVAPTPPNVKPIGNKWVFVRKRNENNEIVRYKARLVVQGFSQRPGIDYEETYSSVMDVITFRYLISLVVSEKLNMQLMDLVITYLYGDLDTEIYMRVPDGLKLPEASSYQPQNTFSIRLRRSLYGLKQSGRMWYNRLSEYLIGLGYLNNELCTCVFIRKSTSGYAIIAVYVDDMNLIGTSKELLETAEILKKEFEMKDLGKTRYCLGLQIEHRKDGILIHQENYTQKVLRHFSHHDAKPSSTPMIVRSLDIKKDPFRPKEDYEEILSPECSYLDAIGALLYLSQCTRPDISFAVNCLARHSNTPPLEWHQRHFPLP
ncbi:hypothetical protein OSB04_032280 [Centaurea solstitialis]|uniref:Reverse transcriptase Ty1/copia-type domain-containing protein n=1 Tax=Centaurea solstitialis TaxID=347529 RepID=A0AA38SUQ1_9ASTR|nr:hypothetical protein OSB04_032280 [Centaurea solstitialis]